MKPVNFLQYTYFSRVSIYLACSLFFLLIGINLEAQDHSLIEFSGRVFTENKGNLQSLQYVGVGILRTRRGSFTDDKGFFSLAVQRGDTIQFNYLGYQKVFHFIPKDPGDSKIYKEFILKPDTFQLERAIVFPIPSKEHFKPEFLEMDVSDKMKDLAQKNIASDVLARIEPGLPADGRARMSLYLSQEAQKAYYDGQFQPQKIFSPIAWIEFFKALKRGDFKKKKK